MDRVRDLVVIELLLVITGLLGNLTAAVTGTRGFAALGSAAFLFALAGLVGLAVSLIVETVREWQAGRDEKRREDEAWRARPSALDRRAQLADEGTRLSAPVTPTAMLDPDGGVSQLDPQKRRPPHS